MTDLQAPIAGRYLLRTLVGHGGMGRVWLAEDVLLGRQVAIKEVVAPHWLSAEERGRWRELTIREAQATARINHEHVVRIYDVVQQDAWPWIVMEYVPSKTLYQVIAQNGPLDPLAVALIGLALLDALSAAHRVGVLHRDVKPSNVLISEDGRIVLTDFGLATFEAGGAITQGTILGSPQFIAPERAMYGLSSIQADLWSLGATLFAAVEGRSPYARETVTATLAALATQPPDTVRQAGPLRPVLEGLLRREPADRISALELRRLLMRVVDPVDDFAPAPALPPPDVPPRRLSRAVAMLAVMGLLVVPGDLVAGAVPPAPEARTKVDAAGQLAPVACGNRPVNARSIPDGQVGPRLDYRLMDDWSWFAQAGSGFAVAIPSTWEYWRLGEAFCFQDRHGGRVLSIDASGQHGQDPVAAAHREMARLLASGMLPGYRLIGVTRLQMMGESARWEFTHVRNGYEHRAVMLFLGTPSGVHTIFWSTDAPDFQPSQAYFDVVRGSYVATRS